MTRDQALGHLGLPPDAGPAQVRRAYRRQALPLKTQIMTAPRVWLKDRYREDLRDLVLARDAALGLPDRAGWRGALPGPDRQRFLVKLELAAAGDLDDRGARAFLGLAAAAGRDEVMQAYRLRSRVLVRCYAAAMTDDEMRAIRRARAKLRTIRNFALSRAS
ncbi:MAG TPA: hypothetical protein VFY93_05015 [Planctomycetota bacterium]|nr:hypothetical protein [Planctomycetota bacterium]